MPDAFADAMDALTGPTPAETNLAGPIADALPVNGVAISTLGDFLGNETVSASNDMAARLDELQFDLGEGPCWDAFGTGRPVLEPDVRQKTNGRWPAFADAILKENIGAIYAFPLFVGPLHLGAIDMYSTEPRTLTNVHTRQSTAFASVVSRLVLHRALERAGDDRDSGTQNDTRFSRRTIHQATGMVLAQLDLPPDEARLVIQAHAFAMGRTMQEIAEDIVERRLTFSMSNTGIEESP
ncbi:GAF and ANTAR domain-containing protein [Mycetocola sp. 2940]|uniref:GAF and ANTAR domain-containing protein n=1 Tax=Mycetocola sp. 2940 TaxID=3156452 RepID=UPI0033952982